MEFTALSGAKIENLIPSDLRTKISFDANIFNIDAKFEIENILEIFKNNKLIELNDDLKSLETTIKNVDVEIIDIEEDTFSKATIETENGDIFVFAGDMKGRLLNMQEFQDLLSPQDDDYDNYDDEDYDNYDDGYNKDNSETLED